MNGRAARTRRGARRVALAVVASAVVIASGLLSANVVPAEPASCPPKPALAGLSVARRWDDALLAVIRRSLPNPPVHARNLFHLSVAMWDAWAAYDGTAWGYVFTDKVLACDVAASRDEAISYAAYRVLTARFAAAGQPSVPEFDAVMAQLSYPASVTTTEGDTPAAVGNRVGAAVLAYGREDGANEAGGYAAPDYRPANPPLQVALPGIALNDPNRWQPLELGYQVSQNGIPIPGVVQQAIGVHWGGVKPFALPPSQSPRMPIDPGPPPRLGSAATDATFKAQVVEVIRDSTLLDPSSAVRIDISPRSLGGNKLGANDGNGYPSNPVTGAAYEPELVLRGDFYRALAEFWADGPSSETPPGHWNVIANSVSDRMGPELRVAGQGGVVSRLEWDVKLYLALNGAVHDAAIAAWGVKGGYDGARPISMVRYMAALGQSSDPSLPSYHRSGLPLVPGLIEVITRANTANGAPLESLRGHEGEIAVRSWQRGEGQAPHIGWILGTAWMPYQLPTFVTPSFPGYISGHSTFSRAAAEVLAGFTGTPYFPGGLAIWAVPAGSFRIDQGPTDDVILQWATYYDAADQAGQSRLFGGIHVQADDFAGRVTGSTCGKDAWERAQRLYAGLRS